MQATQSRQEQRRRRSPFWSPEAPLIWMAPAVLLLLLYSVYPLLYNIWTSFHKFDPMIRDFVWIGGENWVTLVTDARAFNAVRVTLTYGVLALSIQLTLGLGIAMLLDAGVYARGLWQSLLILPMVTPPAVVGLIFRLLEHSEFGVISWILYSAGILTKQEPLLGGTGQNALFGVLLADIWQWTPFCILILLAGLKSLPIEPLEAAEVDGANAWQKFWQVKLPLLHSVLAVVILFRLIDLYRVFDYIYVMTSGGPGQRTETISYYAYQTYVFINWGYTATLGVAILVVIWVTAFLYTRIFHVEW